MSAPERSTCENETLAIISRLRSGWRPSRPELTGAPVLERWRLFSPGPYALQGWVGTDMKSGIAFALDANAGWVRFIDRWARLGAPASAQPLPTNDTVMRCAEVVLTGRDETDDITSDIRALAPRARGAGLDAASYLLDMAALEAGSARSHREG